MGDVVTLILVSTVIIAGWVLNKFLVAIMSTDPPQYEQPEIVATVLVNVCVHPARASPR